MTIQVWSELQMIWIGMERGQRCRCVALAGSQRGRGRSEPFASSGVLQEGLRPLWIRVFGNKVLLKCVCFCVAEVCHWAVRLTSYFCSTTLFVSTVTGMDVSEASMAATFRGASTVRTPSGDREEVTFSTLAVEGSLGGGEERDK